MSFEHPLLLTGLPVTLILVFLSVFRSRSFKLGHVLVALLISLTIALLVVALALPYHSNERPAQNLVALVDISSSLSDSVGDPLLLKARELATSVNVPLEVIPFAKLPAPSSSPNVPAQSLLGGSNYLGLRSAWERLDIGATNIEKGLTAPALQTNRIALLISDGYETEGAVEDANLRGGPAIFPLVQSKRSDNTTSEGALLEITQLSAPLVAKTQKSVDIRTSLRNSSSSKQSALLVVKHGEKEILRRETTLDPNRESVFIAESDPSAEGLNEITTTLSWNDSSGVHSSSRTIWLAGEKREKILLLSGTEDDSRFLPTILRGQAYEVRAATADNRLASIGSLNDYRVVILNNVPRSQLSSQIEENLPAFVRSGGGLIMIGGNRSFGLGGYIDSAIEDVLPVKLVPPQTEKKRLNVAVQLVIDKSRSMATDNRLDFAKESAAQVVRNLKDDDFIGVIGFDETPFVAQPMAPLSEVREQVLDRVNRLFANRRTELFPAIDEGRRGLMRVSAGRKHMIILTDGKIPDPGEYYYQLVRQMKPLGITISTILIGTDTDDGLLAGIASLVVENSIRKPTPVIFLMSSLRIFESVPESAPLRRPLCSLWPQALKESAAPSSTSFRCSVGMSKRSVESRRKLNSLLVLAIRSIRCLPRGR